MKYKLLITEDFEKQFLKLDRSVQVAISRWINKHLEDCEDPKASGEGLTTNLKGYRRYRIGNYRLLAEIKENALIIVALTIARRSEVCD